MPTHVPAAAPRVPSGLGPAEDVLDAMPDATAVLDRLGTIVAVNRAWQHFTEDNGGSPASTGVGVNYLEVCARSAAAGCADAVEVGAALRAVLQGSTVESVLEYPCPSPAVGRWFTLRVTPIVGAEPGVLISHGNITRRKMAELELERRASQDPLTGLANRARFTHELQSALVAPAPRPGLHVGLLYLDLDGFKPVNDTFGHAAGDQVLQVVAGRLREAARPQDTVARLGGDEFGVVVPRMTEAGLARVATSLGRQLAEPHVIHGHVVRVGASIGACLAQPGDEVADLVGRADEAMYAAKQAPGRRAGA